ncbi:MAG: hypothetical protein ACI4V5_06950 [Prevotella sp.]
MNIKIFKLHWWSAVLIVLGLVSLIALDNYMNSRQEEISTQSDDPVRQRELKKDERNRQSMYMLFCIAGISLVLGVVSAVRRRKQNREGNADLDVSVTVKNGYLQVTGIFRRLELWNRNGEVVFSTTKQTLNLTHIKHGNFILNVRTDKGEFSQMLFIDNCNEVGKGRECWSKSKIEYK